MQLNRVTQGILLACACVASGQLYAETATAESEGELQFDTLVVSGQKTSPNQKAFGIAGAVSSVGEEKRMRSLDSVIRALPGTFTNINPTQGTVSVNIRGMSGFGRVNSMIDGVPQTFFGTSSNSASRYHQSEGGGYGPSSGFGMMVDPNFLAGLEVNRGGANHGSDSINALSGSANLRTIGVDDVVMDGNQVGVLSKFSYGTNGTGPNGMLALGGKQHFSDHHTLGAFFAYSGSKTKANYKRGDGRYSGENDYVRRLDQKPSSWLSKIEWKKDAQMLLLTGRGYQNNVGGRRTENKSYALNYEFKPSELVNVKLLAATNRSNERFNDDANIWLLGKGKTKNKADYLDLNNTSLFHFGEVELSLKYGINMLKNQYSKSAVGVDHNNEAYTPFSPQGKQLIRSGYLVSDLNYNNFGLKTGLTYSRSTTRGFKPPCDVVSRANQVIPSNCFPVGAAHMKMTARSLMPSTTLSYKVNDWFQPFASYSHSSRIPNIQEIFFNNEGSGSMNPFLKPESAKTVEIGFNTDKKNAFIDDDFLGIKLSAYHRRVKNDIYSRSFYVQQDGGLTQHLNSNVLVYHAQLYMNALDKLTHKGIELDMNYDAGFAFANLSYSYQKTALPPDVTATVSTGFGTTAVTEAPKQVAVLTIGGRAFEKALEVGATLKYTGRSKRYIPSGLQVEESDMLQELPKMPVIFDVYGTYQVNKNLLLKMTIQNVTDRNYVDALNSLNSTASQFDAQAKGNDVYSFSNAARGRTYLFGAEARF